MEQRARSLCCRPCLHLLLFFSLAPFYIYSISIVLIYNIGKWQIPLVSYCCKTLQRLFAVFVRSHFDGAHWHVCYYLIWRGNRSNLWGHTVVLFALTFNFIGYWRTVKQITATALKTRRWSRHSVLFTYSPLIGKSTAKRALESSKGWILWLQNGGYSTGRALTPFVVLLLSNFSVLYSAPVGVDDQIDNWDSRPSNPFSHWSPADQARQPWQAAQSSVWLRSTVGTELPRLVHKHAKVLFKYIINTLLKDSD